MIRAAENAKSYQYAGELRNPKNWRDRLSEWLPEEWAFDPLEDEVDGKPNHPHAWLQLGQEEQKRGYFRDAISSYTQAIALDQNFAEAYQQRASAYLALGHYRSAHNNCNAAIQASPRSIEAYTLRALVSERLLDYEAAIQDHNVALILKGQPVRAKPKRSLASEVIGKIYRFSVEKIFRPSARFVDSLIGRQKSKAQTKTEPQPKLQKISTSKKKAAKKTKKKIAKKSRTQSKNKPKKKK